MFDVKFFITGDKLKVNESSLIMMNHRTTIDWLFFWEVFWQQSSVKSEKIILKRSLKWVPGFGWAMQIAMYVFLARKWEVDQPWIKMMLDYFQQLKYKAQILIFPEGTDMNERSLSKSHSYAKKNGLQSFEYVLHPRTTGFVYIAQTMREKGVIDAIYDVTVGYPCQIPACGELDSLYGNFPDEVHFHIRRHSIDTIPTSDEDLENWCIEKWKEKEKTLEKFYQKDKCFHDDHQNGVTNNVQGKSTTIDRFVLWSVMGFWVIFAIFVPTLLWYSSLARYQVVIFGILMHLVNLLGGVEKLAFCTMSWRYGKTSKLFS
ncbi:lysocardiolipin acyltransferase 1-like isoform X2 [Apostichopus japonicus]